MTPSIANQSGSIDTTSRFKALYNSLIPHLESTGKDKTIKKQIDYLFSRIASDSVTILVCGEVKRGKSSIVNALIGEDLCPVDDRIATSSVSLIRYGTKPKVIRHFLDSSNKTATEMVDFNHIECYSKGSSVNIDNTILLEIEIPSEKLKSGLCIIDSPGIGGLDPRHLSLTTFALTKADCVFFVVDAGEPISASELEFIKDKIAPFGRNLKIVLNKIDSLLKEQIPALIKDTQQKVLQHGVSCAVDVIPTSMHQWQLYTITGEESYKVASNMAGLEKGISDIRAIYKNSLYPLLKAQLILAANEVKATFQAQLQTLSDPNPELISKLQEQGRQIAQTKKELEQPNSKFNRELSAIIDKTQDEVMAKFSSDTIILSSSKLEELLNSERAKTSEGIQYVSKKLNKSLLKLCGQLDSIIDAGFEEVMSKAQISFEEDKPEYGSILPSNMRIKEKKMSEEIFKAVRNGTSGMAVISLGGFISSIAAVPVIMPVAVAGGLCMAAKAIVDGFHAGHKAEIHKHVQPQLTIAINELRTYVQNRFKNFSKTLKEALLSRVAEMEAEMMSVRLQLEECATDMQKIAHQKEELQKKIAFIDTIIKQLNILLNNPFKAG